MIDIERYLSTPYEQGGRASAGLDCWGLVLAVRAELGLPVLDSASGVDRQTPLQMQRLFKQLAAGMQKTELLKPGTIAAVFRAGVFVHVGVVLEIEGRTAVLETNPASGVRWMFLDRFLQTYFRVGFYCD